MQLQEAQENLTMPLPLRPPLEPMEAQSVAAVPHGEIWQYEPKWDGFRCLCFKDGRNVELQSKAEKPLTRYFPELVAELQQIKAACFVLDGEIVIPEGSHLSFDLLLQRIHPAESRVRKLAAESPASLIVFDLLVNERGQNFIDKKLAVRRRELERFAEKYLDAVRSVLLSPCTPDLRTAKQWMRKAGNALDGLIAKDTTMAYRPGLRDAVRKIKTLRTADCVVGGFRYGSKSRLAGSLLLGLYDDAGLLHHVGFTAIAAGRKAELTAMLEPLIKPPGFTGRAPGGPSRWSSERSTEWQPLRPKVVVEVQYDHVSGDRFRHGTKLLRFRPDKRPAQCTMEQLRQSAASPLELLS